MSKNTITVNRNLSPLKERKLLKCFPVLMVSIFHVFPLQLLISSTIPDSPPSLFFLNLLYYFQALCFVLLFLNRPSYSSLPTFFHLYCFFFHLSKTSAYSNSRWQQHLLSSFPDLSPSVFFWPTTNIICLEIIELSV